MRALVGLALLGSFCFLMLGPAACGTRSNTCGDDNECSKGEICELALCVPGCRINQDCPAKEICFNKKCTPEVCQPGEKASCYSGSSLTKGVPLCRDGVKYCLDDGTSWSPCVLEVLPQLEVCDRADNDCDGQVDEALSCACEPGAKRSCYHGPLSALSQGVCRAGIQYCEKDRVWGVCTGQVLPSQEVCDEKDNNCNGMVDEWLDCRCQPGETRKCYTGPEKTKGVGICQEGSQTCTDQNKWGPCAKEVTPRLEEDQPCNGLDDDCDGEVDNRTGKPKEPLDASCFDGSTGDLRQGTPCRSGTKTCQGGKWSPCEGQILPAKEDLCQNNKDEGCGSAFQFGCYNGCEGSRMKINSKGHIFLMGYAGSGTINIGNSRATVTPGYGGMLLSLNSSQTVSGLTPFSASNTSGNIKSSYYTYAKLDDMTIDSKDNVYVVGHFTNRLQVQNRSILVDRFSSHGNPNGFFAKFDANNKLLDLRTIVPSTGQSRVKAVAVDANGKIYLAIEYNTSVVIGSKIHKPVSSGTDILVVAYDAAMKPLWSVSGGSNGNDGATRLLTQGGSLFLTGFVASQQFVWGTTYNQTTSPNSFNDTFVLQMSTSTGALGWVWRSTQARDAYPTGMALGPSGSLFLVGRYRGVFHDGVNTYPGVGPENMFLTHLDSKGAVKWTRGFSGLGQMRPSEIITNGKGDLFVAGGFSGIYMELKGTNTLRESGLGGSDLEIFLAKFDTAKGEPKWLRTAGGAGTDSAYALALDSKGNLLVTGVAKSSCLLGTANMSSPSGNGYGWFWSFPAP